MLLATIQQLVLTFLTIVYPVYKSIKVIRKQEEPRLKLRLIKFW